MRLERKRRNFGKIKDLNIHWIRGVMWVVDEETTMGERLQKQKECKYADTASNNVITGTYF